MLELRPSCEPCDRDLPPDAVDARICSYVCTFCVDCVENVLTTCPNCGGGFRPRPIRPAQAWRDGTGLVNDAARDAQAAGRVTREESDALVARLRDVPPGRR